MMDRLPHELQFIQKQQKDITKLKQLRDSLINDKGVIKGKAEHPNYASLESRIRTYNNSNWRVENIGDIQELSRAGFFNIGYGDSVCCFHCDVRIRNWQSSDCPWKHHALLSQNCGHLRRCRGDNFIQSVRLAYREPVDSAEGDVDEDNHAVLSLDTLSSFSRALKINSIAVEAAKSYIDSEDRIHKAVAYLVSQGRMTFSGTELCQASDECDMAWSDTIQESAAQTENLQRQNEGLKQPLSCKICLDALACIIVIPCGHMFSCPQCIAPLRTCAVCRSKISGTVRVRLCNFNKDTIE